MGRRLAIFASIGSIAAGEVGTRAHGRTKLAKEQDGGRLAGVVSRLPVPSAIGVGGAKGAFHRRAQDQAHRRADRARDAEEDVARPWRSRGPCSEKLDATESGAAATAATETEVDVMGRTSEERGRIEPQGALSTAPAQTRPGRASSSQGPAPRKTGSRRLHVRKGAAGAASHARSHSAAMICGRSSSARRWLRPRRLGEEFGQRPRLQPPALLPRHRSPRDGAARATSPYHRAAARPPRAMSPFFRWSMSCADGSPFASRTASRMRGLVTRPR